jgi:hypothetical protein
MGNAKAWRESARDLARPGSFHRRLGISFAVGTSWSICNHRSGDKVPTIGGGDVLKSTGQRAGTTFCQHSSMLGNLVDAAVKFARYEQRGVVSVS